jgi:hypothetical protein
MTRSHTFAIALAIPLLLGATTPLAASDEPDAVDPRIRTDDRHLQRLIDEGMRRSATLRALGQRITRSDVVVYVFCDGDPQSRIAGRMTFLSAAGGMRYLVVRLAPLQSRVQLIAMLAHELQHVVEVADTPAIVDSESLAREYLRIGHVNRHSPTPGLAFDTRAAIAIGHRVLDELD